jgi:hypothetical protein
MIASTTPKAQTNTAIKPNQLPPMQYLQGGGSISNYTFQGLTGQNAQFNGMTYAQVRDYIQRYQQSINEANGVKPPSTVTGSSSTDQALGTIGGLGASVGTAYLVNQAIKPAATIATQGGSIGGQVASQGIANSGNIASTTSQAPQIASSLGQSGGLAAQGTSEAVGTAVNGGTMLADGTIQGGSTALGQYASAVSPYLTLGATAYQVGNQAYEGYQGGVGKEFGESIQEEGKRQLSTPMLATGVINPYVWFWAAQAALGGAGAGSLFGSSKEPERMARKEGRRAFQNQGLMNADSRSRYNLADGTQYDIRDREDKKAYNVDENDPNAAQGVGLTNALANAIIGGGNKVSRDLSGELYNSYTSNGNFDANIRAAYDKVGGRDAVYQGVADRWLEAKKRGEDTYTAAQRDADFASIDRLYGIKNEANARWEDSQNLSDKDIKRNVDELAKGKGDQPKAPATVQNQATTKPLPVQGPEVNRNGGRPATPIVNNTKKGKKK